MGLKIEGALIAMRRVDTARRLFVDNVFYVRGGGPVPATPMQLLFKVTGQIEYCIVT